MRHALKGEREPLWIVANSQIAGKGRRNRHWASEPGNLYASLLLVNTQAIENSITLPFVASLALVEAITAVTGAKFPSLAIKWPNDVLFNGRKLSGILLEASPLRDGSQAIVIGFGINCNNSPKLPIYPATSLADEGFDVDPALLLRQLQQAMHWLLGEWAQGAGFSSLRIQWLKWAAGIGEMITARFDDHQQSGLFRDIDAKGFLLLDTNEGIKKISAADIFFGRNGGIRKRGSYD